MTRATHSKTFGVDELVDMWKGKVWLRYAIIRLIGATILVVSTCIQGYVHHCRISDDVDACL
jgi:hypothetical protein